jgi:hypothetical protein
VIDLDTRVFTLLLWGLGTVLIYGAVLVMRVREYRRHHDRRSRREVMIGFVLFLTALGSGLAVAFVLFGEAATTLRGISTAIALGAFTGAGLVMLSEGTGEKLGR